MMDEMTYFVYCEYCKASQYYCSCMLCENCGNKAFDYLSLRCLNCGLDIKELDAKKKGSDG